MNSALDPTKTDIRCVLPIGGGRLVLSGWPGLRITPVGDAWIDPEATAATLADLHDLGVTFLVALCDFTDLPRQAVPHLRHWTRQDALRLIHAPIRDYHPPDDRFLRHWQALAPHLYRQIEAGAAVALTCSYGAGRSGTIAALMLAEHGCPMPDAIRQVRVGFHAAIESAVQEQWLLERTPGGKPGTQPAGQGPPARGVRDKVRNEARGDHGSRT